MRRLVAYSFGSVRGQRSANHAVWESGTAGWDIYEYSFVEAIQCSCFTIFAFHHRRIPAMVLSHTEHSVQEDLLVDEHFGQSITPNNDKFAVTEVRGDWSWHKKVFRFRETSWNGIKICHWCQALSAGEWSNLYWNLGPSSNWVNQLFDFDEWCEQRLPYVGI